MCSWIYVCATAEHAGESGHRWSIWKRKGWQQLRPSRCFVGRGGQLATVAAAASAWVLTHSHYTDAVLIPFGSVRKHEICEKHGESKREKCNQNEETDEYRLRRCFDVSFMSSGLR